MSAQFVEAEGAVHVINPIMGEFTLCGDAFDLGSDVSGYEWKVTTKRTVTCAPCSVIVRRLRGVRAIGEHP